MTTEMNIRFVPKDKIWPLFGYYDHSADTIFIGEVLI